MPCDQSIFRRISRFSIVTSNLSVSFLLYTNFNGVQLPTMPIEFACFFFVRSGIGIIKLSMILCKQYLRLTCYQVDHRHLLCAYLIAIANEMCTAQSFGAYVASRRINAAHWNRIKVLAIHFFRFFFSFRHWMQN